MPYASAVSVIVLSTLLLSSCGGNESVAPILSDGENPDAAQEPMVGQSQVDTDNPIYLGDLEFTETMTVDLDPLLDQSDLNRAYSGVMARDGSTVRVPVKSQRGHDKAFVSINTESGEASWLFRSLGDDTRILFDANNQAIAVLAIGCGSVSYMAEQEVTLFDMTSALPEGRCFSVDQRVSANGEVVLLGSYINGTGTPYLSTTTDFHAYTFNTASLIDYPDIRLEYDGVNLTPQWPDSLFSGAGFSDDGRYLLTRQWWEGTESFGGTRRQVGAVRWDTSSGDWQVVGLMADQRGCIATQKVSCRPTYSYVMSSDGMTQYSQIPTSEEINQGSGPVVQFATITEKSVVNQPNASVVAGLESGASLSVDSSGRYLVFVANDDSDSLRKGYMLYDDQTGRYASLNRALRTCPVRDDSGNTIDESNCAYISVPGTIASNATHFSANGTTLLLSSISRSTEKLEHAVDNFLVDISDKNVFTIPEPFSGDPLGISGDGTLMLGVTGFPDYDFVIGKR